METVVKLLPVGFAVFWIMLLILIITGRATIFECED